MEGSKVLFILLASVSAFMIMFIVLYVQWRLEREANGQKPAFVFHIFNVMTMVMFYGATYMSLIGMNLDYLERGGHDDVLLQAILYPLPFIILCYSISAYLYHRYIRPVVKVKDSNVILLRRKWHNIK